MTAQLSADREGLQENTRLREELRTAQRDLCAAYARFNQAVEPELIDACIYRIRAETARCDYLFRAMKSRAAQRTDGTEEDEWT